MSTVCGRPQGGRGSGPCGRMWTGERGVKNVIFVDVINGWPLILYFFKSHHFRTYFLYMIRYNNISIASCNSRAIAFSLKPIDVFYIIIFHDPSKTPMGPSPATLPPHPPHQKPG